MKNNEENNFWQWNVCPHPLTQVLRSLYRMPANVVDFIKTSVSTLWRSTFAQTVWSCEDQQTQIKQLVKCRSVFIWWLSLNIRSIRIELHGMIRIETKDGPFYDIKLVIIHFTPETYRNAIWTRIRQFHWNGWIKFKITFARKFRLARSFVSCDWSVGLSRSMSLTLPVLLVCFAHFMFGFHLKRHSKLPPMTN